MIFDISSTNNKVFRERIWIDISKICKKFIDLLYLSKISKEREKRGKDTERLMRDRRTVSKSKTVFPGSWWSEAFRGEFFRLPDATQVKRGILVSLVPSLCGQKKKNQKNRVTGIVVHAHHPRIAIFHEGRGISGPSNWFFDSRERTAILEDAIAETLHRNEPIEPRHRR